MTTPAQLGQFTVVAILCLVAATLLLRAIRRHHRAHARAARLATLRVLAATTRREDLEREVQQMMDALRERVEHQPVSPRGRTP